MKSPDPLKKAKGEYDEIISRISFSDSPVGIDAQYTHAIIIEYLRQIVSRLDKLEAVIQKIQQRGAQ